MLILPVIWDMKLVGHEINVCEEKNTIKLISQGTFYLEE